MDSTQTQTVQSLIKTTERATTCTSSGTSCFEGRRKPGEPPTQRWGSRGVRELMATSIKCWPDGEPINSAGRFSSQPGVLVRRRPKLTAYQRCTATQNEGQSLASVTEKWRREKELMQVQLDQKEVQDLEWNLEPKEDLSTRLAQARNNETQRKRRQSIV